MGLKDKIYDLLNIFPRTGELLNSEGRIVNEADVIGGFAPNLVNGKPQGTVFGSDMVISMEKAQVSGKWSMGINLAEYRSSIVTTGYGQVTPGESTIGLRTGVSPTGAIFIQTVKRVRYEPGTPLFEKFTAAFPPLSASNGNYTMGIGLGDGEDGIFLGHRRRNGALEYGFILVKGEIETWVPYNGVLPTDPDNLNIYRMDAGYLGIAPTNLYWVDTENEVFKRLHRELYNQRVTSVRKPDLPAAAFVRNEGNTTDLALINGSFEAGTVNGGPGFDPSARQFTHERVFSAVAGTNVLIFAYRNPEVVNMHDFVDINDIPTFRAFTNSIASQLLEVNIDGVGNNKIVQLSLWKMPIADILTGTFTPIKAGESVLEVSTNATFTLANATKLDNYSLGSPKEIQELALLFPEEAAVFVYTTTSVTFDMRAFIKFRDLF